MEFRISDFGFRIRKRARGRRAVSVRVPPNPNSEIQNPKCARRGLSLVEMLIALAISALLLTATTVAVEVSFRAYAIAAESASAQTSTRMVTHRLLAMVRTSVAHEPVTIGTGVSYHDPAPDNPNIPIDQNTLVSNHLEMLDTSNNLIRIEHDASTRRLYVTTTPDAGNGTPSAPTPLLDNVTDCTFFMHRRVDRDGVIVLYRATMDLTVQPDEDPTLTLERGNTPAIRMIASTMPRRLD